MAENNENIKITVVEKRGKRGCDYGHRVGDIYDYAKDAGRLCPCQGRRKAVPLDADCCQYVHFKT